MHKVQMFIKKSLLGKNYIPYSKFQDVCCIIAENLSEQGIDDNYDFSLELSKQLSNYTFMNEGKIHNDDFKIIHDCILQAQHATFIRNLIAQSIAESKNKKLFETPVVVNANVEKFLKSLKKIGFLFKDPEKSAKCFVRFINNLRNRLGDEKSQTTQKQLYLYSETGGGCGKTYFCENLKEVLKRKHKALIGSGHIDNFLDPNEFKTVLTVFSDSRQIAGPFQEVMNNIIDNSRTEYSIKYGPKGFFEPTCVTITTSNWIIPERNSRRYDVVEYLPLNISDSDTEYEKFKLTRFEMQNVISEMLETCPYDILDIKCPKKSSSKITLPLEQEQFGNILLDAAEYAKEYNVVFKPMKFLRFYESCIDKGLMKTNTYEYWCCKAKAFFQYCQNLGMLKVYKSSWSLQNIDWLGLIKNLTIDTSEVSVESINAEWDKLISLNTQKNDPNNDQDNNPKIPKANYSGSQYECQALNPDHEFEVLNPLDESKVAESLSKNESPRRDDNVASMRNFLFECDEMPLDEQMKLVEIYKNSSDGPNRAVYSGGKSVHFRITIQDEPMSKDCYKEIWNYLNKRFFNSEADKHCSNPSRLTRMPKAKRKDLEHFDQEQELLFENNNIVNVNIKHYENIAKLSKEAESIRGIFFDKDKVKSVKNFKSVKYYLNNSFSKMRGNGNSDDSLYKALIPCLKYSDKETLDEIVAKAFAEKWTQAQIDHKIKDAEKYLKKVGDLN